MSDKRILWVEDSSLINRLDYWPEEKIMDALFEKGGALYRYFDVDRVDFATICAAESVGSTFHTLVNGKKYERLI